MTDPARLYDQAMAACNRADWRTALELASGLLDLAPDHAGVHYLTGTACLELGRKTEALEHLRRATVLDPQRPAFAIIYAKALMLAELPALDAADRARALGPASPALLTTLAMVYARENAHALAAELFGQVIRSWPRHAPCRYARAMSLLFLGDVERAHAELDACLAIDPTFWRAYLTRSETGASASAGDRAQALAVLLARHGSRGEAAVCLHMALARELERLGDYDGAFEHLTQGKREAGKGRGYRSERDAALGQAIREAFGPVPAPSGLDPDQAPVFVVGMPRTGTTLVERIISSHPAMRSAGELRNFPLAFKRHSLSPTHDLLDADTLARSGRIDWPALGRDYLASVQQPPGTPGRFVDKLPHNFLYAGAIALALPAARIVCLRRHPMDTCLSNLRQLFAPDSPFHDYACDLLDIGRYYVLFDQLVAHWRLTLPGRFLEVDYEALVTRSEDTSRRLVEFCGLPWDDACLRSERNQAPASTASASQVREPIHTRALERWRKYAGQLLPLERLLSAEGIDVR